MKVISRVLVSLAICHALGFVAFAEDRVHVAARSGSSVAGAIDGIPFIVLRGTVKARGEALGVLWGDYSLRALADVVLLVNKNDPQGWEKLVQMADQAFTIPDEVTQQMQAFLGSVRQTIPLEKRTAILGRDVEVKDIKATYAFADLVSSGRISVGACSSFSAWGELTADGNTIVGRNLDYNTYPVLLPFAIVAQAPSEKDRLATIDITTLWLGASTIMNEKGVLALVHDEPGLAITYQSGFLPRLLSLRSAIETALPASAPEHLAAALRDQHPAMGTNFHVSMPVSPKGALPTVLEWDGNPKDHGVTLRTPDAKENLPAIFCTNHYLARADHATGRSSSSVVRYNTMSKMVQDTLAGKQKIDVKAAEQILAAVSMKGRDFSTHMSVVALPATRQLHIALSRAPGTSATDGPWVQVDWNDIFSAK